MSVPYRDIFLRKQFIVTALLIFFTLVFLGIFSQSDKVNPIFQTLLVSVTFFLVVPVLYSKIVLGEPIRSLGWQAGNVFVGILASIVCVALALGAMFLFMRYTPFQQEYLLPVTAQLDFFWFLLYELVLVSLTTLLYEVFFRGLVQLLWLRPFGLLAVLLQAVLFMGLLYFSDDFSWQRAPLIVFSPLAGLIAYLSGSLWYSWAASWAFLFLTDIFLLVIH
jgi:membrane protease YdiL (CAAX protease family)